MAYTEPDMLLMHRPIIKEEELERMDTIAKDEGWAKHDEIDYNQKLNLSDDEDIEQTVAPVKESKNTKEQQQKIANKDEDNRAGEFQDF